MKICPYCGKRQSDEYNFCTYCNKELYPIAGAEPVHLAPPPEEIQQLTPEPVIPLVPEAPITSIPEPALPPAPSEEIPPSAPSSASPGGKRKWLAVIGIVIIIVVASAAYFLLVPKVKSPPIAKAEVNKENGWFVVNITEMSPSVSARGIRYILQDKEGNTIGEGLVAEIYSKEVNYTKFVDSNADGQLSVGDKFFIKSPPAEVDYKLILKYEPTGAEFLKETLRL